MPVTVLAAIIAIAVPGPVFSVSLEELAGTERAKLLRSSPDPLTEVQSKNPEPRLLPQHDELRRLVAETADSLEPNILVETLSVVKAPGIEQLSLFNHLTAISSLAGIQYYSERRNTMRTFYETSSVIDNPADKTPLPDPVFSTLPATLELYARQKDLTFGDNIYRYHYYTGDGFIFFVQENLTAMNAGIIPAVGKNKCRNVVAVIDTGDSLLVYAAAMAKTVSLPGMGERIGISFTNRIKAILSWFADRVA